MQFSCLALSGPSCEFWKPVRHLHNPNTVTGVEFIDDSLPHWDGASQVNANRERRRTHVMVLAAADFPGLSVCMASSPAGRFHRDGSAHRIGPDLPAKHPDIAACVGVSCEQQHLGKLVWQWLVVAKPARWPLMPTRCVGVWSQCESFRSWNHHYIAGFSPTWRQHRILNASTSPSLHVLRPATDHVKPWLLGTGSIIYSNVT